MPFASKRQQRAAFAGVIPGFSKAKAKEWADKTDFSKIPEKASALQYMSQYIVQNPEFFVKLAFSLPKPGKLMKGPSVGAFTGKATQNFLKPPGPAASSQVINPRKSIANTFKKPG
jgi:hypothetical protein